MGAWVVLATVPLFVLEGAVVEDWESLEQAERVATSAAASVRVIGEVRARGDIGLEIGEGVDGVPEKSHVPSPGNLSDGGGGGGT